MNSINPLLLGTAGDASGKQELRFFATDSTKLVQEAVNKHGTSVTASAALGRTLMAAGLLAQILSKQSGERISLRVEGGGSIGHIMAEATRSSDGLATLRGYVQHPNAELPPRDSDGKLDVGGLVGLNGEFSVTRLRSSEGEPYISSVPLVSGEIGQDAARYLLESEQIPSAVLLGVFMDNSGVAMAGGVIVQAMPEASEAVLSQLETNLSTLPHLTTLLKEEGLLAALSKIFAGLNFQINSQEQLLWRCRCSATKALDSLRFFSPTEFDEMILAGGQEVVCHWCNTHYKVLPAEIKTLK